MDFRFLILNKEESNVKATINILKRRFSEGSNMRSFLEKGKAHFEGDPMFSFSASSKRIDLETLINLKFNTEYFHSGNPMQTEDIADINAVFEEASVRELLFWAIYEKWYSVQCLYAMAKDVNSENSAIYLPDSRLLK